MAYLLRFRFDERDEMYKKIKNNSLYITDNEINTLLNEHEWSDLTFIFSKEPYVHLNKIIDNNNDEEVLLNELNQLCFDFYNRKLYELSDDNKINIEINKIKNILYNRNEKESLVSV